MNGKLIFYFYKKQVYLLNKLDQFLQEIDLFKQARLQSIQIILKPNRLTYLSQY